MLISCSVPVKQRLIWCSGRLLLLSLVSRAIYLGMWISVKGHIQTCLVQIPSCLYSQLVTPLAQNPDISRIWVEVYPFPKGAWNYIPRLYQWVQLHQVLAWSRNVSSLEACPKTLRGKLMLCCVTWTWGLHLVQLSWLASCFECNILNVLISMFLYGSQNSLWCSTEAVGAIPAYPSGWFFFFYVVFFFPLRPSKHLCMLR